MNNDSYYRLLQFVMDHKIVWEPTDDGKKRVLIADDDCSVVEASIASRNR